MPTFKILSIYSKKLYPFQSSFFGHFSNLNSHDKTKPAHTCVQVSDHDYASRQLAKEEEILVRIPFSPSHQA